MTRVVFLNVLTGMFGFFLPRNMCVFVAVVGLHGPVQVSRVGGDGDVIRSCIDLCRVQELDESSSLSRCDVDVEQSSLLGGCVGVSLGMLHCVIRAPPSLVFSCQTRRCKSNTRGHRVMGSHQHFVVLLAEDGIFRGRHVGRQIESGTRRR
ncbi:hypothetical protein QAD02_009519 [Eretmocerus hayati]|uniref:Uncharacterized protein n=1 Tax=Eretmocerus hayati TaxID=131215 RepID=A0ACC2NAX2_9HYME|nr:hypothetical protein QAD02_009519 [Eretmocerus hayati]